MEWTMSIGDHGLYEFEGAVLKDAWYELEGAYEVFGIGRCRFVFVHCRSAMLISLVLLAKKKGFSISECNIESLGRRLKMPQHLINSCMAIEQAGRYEQILNKKTEDQECAEIILNKTLEAFEWIRGKIAE
jgi:hypothetical protein